MHSRKTTGRCWRATVELLHRPLGWPIWVGLLLLTLLSARMVHCTVVCRRMRGAVHRMHVTYDYISPALRRPHTRDLLISRVW